MFGIRRIEEAIHRRIDGVEAWIHNQLSHFRRDVGDVEDRFYREINDLKKEVEVLKEKMDNQ